MTIGIMFYYFLVNKQLHQIEYGLTVASSGLGLGQLGGGEGTLKCEGLSFSQTWGKFSCQQILSNVIF